MYIEETSTIIMKLDLVELRFARGWWVISLHCRCMIYQRAFYIGRMEKRVITQSHSRSAKLPCHPMLLARFFLDAHYRWHGVAVWKWDVNDDVCGICRLAFDACCPDCTVPGDSCSPGE